MRSGNADSAKLAWRVPSPYAAHPRMIAVPALCLRMFCATTALMKTVPLLWCAYTAHGWRH